MEVNNYFPTFVFHKSPSSVIVSTFYFVTAYVEGDPPLDHLLLEGNLGGFKAQFVLKLGLKPG